MTKKKIIFFLVTTISITTTTVAPITEPPCPGPGNHPAQNCYQYYQCVSSWWWYEPELLSCDDGYAFDIASSECQVVGAVDCQQRDSTPGPTTTTTAAPTTTPPPPIPQCDGYSRHPAPLCYQYYECAQVYWWSELSLRTCPDGLAYDKSIRRCVCAQSVGCVVPDKEPECNGDYGKYPAQQCNQYYRCVQTLWWWSPDLYTCPEGQRFDKSVMECGDSGPECSLSGSE